MMENPGYRSHLAGACVRLYRPLKPTGPRRSWLDQLLAHFWTYLDICVYRHFGVSLGVKPLGVDNVLVLRTRGRRSGRVREVLLAYLELDGALVICGANGGWNHHPAWFENLRGGGPVEIERHRRRQVVTPMVLQGDERDRAYMAVSEAFPQVHGYLKSTARPFPLVRLSPLDVSAPPPIPPAGHHHLED